MTNDLQQTINNKKRHAFLQRVVSRQPSAVGGFTPALTFASLRIVFQKVIGRSQPLIESMDLIPVATAQQKTTRKLVHGFTLIEMLVAVALFTVVMLIAIGTLTSMINADRKAQSLQSIVDSLQFVLDDMSRSILTGVTFHCTTGSENPDPTLTDTKDCFSGSGSSYIAVEGARGNPSDAYDQIVYWFSAESCKNGPGGSILPLYIGGCIEKSNDTGTTWSPLTPPEVGVDYLSFFVQGSGLGDSIQPRAFAVISAHVALPDGKSTKLNVQTSFTQRIFDQ